MNKKKGFTLIELLAIIVILAIIAVITVPLILNIINDAKQNASIDSAYGYKSALEKYYMKKVVENTENELPNGYKNISELPEDFIVSGESPSDGWVKLKKGLVDKFSLKYDEYVVTMDNDKNVTSEKKEQVYPHVTDDYQEVEYLESTGTQYVDTGYIPNSNTKIEIQFMAINNPESSNIPLFGARTSINSTDSYTTFFKTTTGNGRIDYSTSSGKSTAFPSDKKITFIKDKEKNYIDGALKNSNSTSNFFGTYSLYLNNVNTSGASYDSTLLSNKLYYTMIWNNGNLVRNFVPVIRKSDNKPGLLDLATRTNNLFNKEALSYNEGYIKQDGTLYSMGNNTMWVVSDYIPVSSGKSYIASNLSRGGSGTYCAIYDEEKNFVRSLSITANQNVVFNIANGEKYIRLSVRKIDNEIQTTMLNEGSTALPYEPYGYKFYTNAGTDEFITGPEI